MSVLLFPAAPKFLLYLRQLSHEICTLLTNYVVVFLIVFIHRILTCTFQLKTNNENSCSNFSSSCGPNLQHFQFIPLIVRSDLSLVKSDHVTH